MATFVPLLKQTYWLSKNYEHKEQHETGPKRKGRGLAHNDIEPEEFSAAAKELLELLRRIPLPGNWNSFYEGSINSWERTFNSIKTMLVHYSEYRKKGSRDKRYYKPALNFTLTRDLLESFAL